MGQDIPSCVQPRLLADSDIITELPKQGLKHFPGKTTSNMPCYGCRLCPLQHVFGANFKCQEMVPQSLAQGRKPRTNHTAKIPLPWGFSCPPRRNQGRRAGRGLQISVPTCKPQQQLMWPIEHNQKVKCDVMLVMSVFPGRATEQRLSSPQAHFSSLESHLL